MTATVQDVPAQKRRRGAAAAPSRPAGWPSVAQVNLLPPEVRAKRGLAHVKQWLAVVLVFVLIVVALAYAGAQMLKQTADAALVDAQMETARLQQEQQKYAEVPEVLNGLKRTEEARLQGMAPEVLWTPYLDAIAAVLPGDVAIQTVTITGGTPSLAAPDAFDALLEPGVAGILFTTETATLPSSSDWIDALNGIPGFSGATFSAATRTADAENTGDYFVVTSSVQVAEGALAQRFVPDEEN